MGGADIGANLVRQGSIVVPGTGKGTGSSWCRSWSWMCRCPHSDTPGSKHWCCRLHSMQPFLQMPCSVVIAVLTGIPVTSVHRLLSLFWGGQEETGANLVRQGSIVVPGTGKGTGSSWCRSWSWMCRCPHSDTPGSKHWCCRLHSMQPFLQMPCSVAIAVLTGLPVTSVHCPFRLFRRAKKRLVQTLCDKGALWSLVLGRALAVAGAARGVGCAGSAVLTRRGASTGVAASTRCNRSCGDRVKVEDDVQLCRYAQSTKKLLPRLER